MHLALTARLQLDPDDDPSGGIVTWFDADIAGLLGDQSERKVAHTSAALIHAEDAGDNLNGLDSIAESAA